MDIRLERAWWILKKLAKLSLFILFWMTLLRLVLYAAVYSGRVGFHPDLPIAFFTGLRFDLSILGFIWIPLILIIWISSLWVDPDKWSFIFKIYFCICVLFIFDLAWIDLFWSQVQGERISSLMMVEGVREVIDQGWEQVGRTRGMVFTTVMSLSSLAVVLSYAWMNLHPKINVSKTPTWKFVVRVLGSVLIVAFAARGTVTPHHIGVQTSRVSENPFVNQLALTPVWTFNKPSADLK